VREEGRVCERETGGEKRRGEEGVGERETGGGKRRGEERRVCVGEEMREGCGKERR
jgi:hypothetical protein